MPEAKVLGAGGTEFSDRIIPRKIKAVGLLLLGCFLLLSLLLGCSLLPLPLLLGCTLLPLPLLLGCSPLLLPLAALPSSAEDIVKVDVTLALGLQVKETEVSNLTGCL